MAIYNFGISPLFTWESVASAFFGGLLLGCSVVFKTSCLGGVLGLSTYIKQLFWLEKKRYFFIGGMVIGSLALDVCWKRVEMLPPPGAHGRDRSLLFLRMIIGNYLLGLGSSLQCGCTSGHGLTGLARLSYQSWFAVPIFMATGLLTGSLVQSAHAFPPQHLDDDLEWFEGPLIAASFAVALLIAALFLTWLGRYGCEEVQNLALLFGEFLVGITFAAGLIISSMAFPSKVASFLDVASGTWDLCLPFVMVGGLCVTFPYFIATEFFKLQSKTLLEKKDLDLPPRTSWPNGSVLRGAVYFGIGWGLCATTPCSLPINLAAAPSWEMASGGVAFVAGLLFSDFMKCGRSQYGDSPENPSKKDITKDGDWASSPHAKEAAAEEGSTTEEDEPHGAGGGAAWESDDTSIGHDGLHQGGSAAVV